jgi:hypothetical protein
MNGVTRQKDSEQAHPVGFGWRNVLARQILRTLTFISLPGILAASWYAIDEGDLFYIPIYAGIWIFMALFAFLPAISDSKRMWVVLALTYGIALLNYATEGRGSLARAFLLTTTVLAAIFYGRRGGISSAVLTFLTMTIFAYLYVNNILPDYAVNSTTLAGWISNTVLMMVLVFMLAISVTYVLREQANLLSNSNLLADALKAERTNLEKTIEERTAAAEAARAEAEAARAEAESARQTAEQERWLALGQAQLAEVTRGEQSVRQLAENILHQTCQYLGAQAGAIYLRNKADTLQLVGGYAFSPHPDFPGGFAIGEGLVGQSAADQRLIHLRNVPEKAVIASGLLEMTPREMLFVPLLENNQVVGVMELASLNQFLPAHYEFTERVAENIGVALRTAEARQRLNALLQTTQHQAEELQLQEEELRATNEQLQAKTTGKRTTKKQEARHA